jgi:hypothetical protein
MQTEDTLRPEAAGAHGPPSRREAGVPIVGVAPLARPRRPAGGGFNPDLTRANLIEEALSRAELTGADLTGARLERAVLVRTRLANADLTGCCIYGMSAWDVDLEGATQKDLIITQDHQPEITVDNLEVAQFTYLLLHNKKLRDVIDTITAKAVLILGRFTPERKVGTASRPTGWALPLTPTPSARRCSARPRVPRRR